MYCLYEEDGDIKAGTILADNDSSLQIESQHGKRAKVKAAHVLLRYAAPGPAEVMDSARSMQGGFDLDFLWEAAGESEFGFTDLAADYFGHLPSAPESTAILLAAHGAPIFFQKKGKGRYKAAPAEQLAAAKLGLERRAREAAQRAEWVAQLKSDRLPEAFAGKVYVLSHKPDKNSPEYKALLEACNDTGLSPARLFQRCGAIPSPHEFHLQAFLLENFPKGAGFPALAELPPPPALPPGDAPAFSIDDAATTEIDDAFSVIFRADGSVRVGIHIAAPALGLASGSELDRLAATRLSTVYMPGGKITMLPEDLIRQYTLAEGRDCPALSLYLEVAADLSIQSLSTQADHIRIEANLRHESLEPLFNIETIGQPGPDYPFRRELEWLFGFARSLEAARGKADQVERHDYVFRVDGEHVEIVPRVRGNPIDKVVSELMILANARWGQLLADKDIAGLYRAQTAGKVRMTAKPAPHEGLGVACYAWSTSPLRRYVDLVNQRQILAAVHNETPPRKANDPEFLAILRDFELAYDAYNEFQRRMERYWCLRWLQQQGIHDASASLIRENLIRIDGLPLVLRMHGAPTLDAGSRVRVAFSDFDLLDIEVDCRFLEVIAA
jgi:exoribonuclease-2